MKPRAASALRVGLTVAVIALLVAFALRVDWPRIWLSVRGASLPLLLAAAGANLLSLLLKGLRWWVFLRPIGITSTSLAIRATFAGAGLNNVLVANAGEAARVGLVARAASAPVERVVATLALERIFEFFGYIILLALAAIFLRLPPALVPVRPYAIVALVVVVLFMVWLVRNPGSDRPNDLPPRNWLGRTAAWLGRVGTTMASVASGPRVIAALTLSLGAWALQVASYHLTAMATNLPLPLAGTVAALLAANLGFALRATPGNVGVFQLFYATAAAGFGMDASAATATAFLIQTQQMLPVTVIGMLMAPELIWTRGVRAKKVRADEGNPLPR